jgi:hypothetical protein
MSTVIRQGNIVITASVSNFSTGIKIGPNEKLAAAWWCPVDNIAAQLLSYITIVPITSPAGNEVLLAVKPQTISPGNAPLRILVTAAINVFAEGEVIKTPAKAAAKAPAKGPAKKVSSTTRKGPKK